tara:strand:+ start:19998 stop:20912 length:915 start_codon:yes stop_codon:yes gene_type:complete
MLFFLLKPIVLKNWKNFYQLIINMSKIAFINNKYVKFNNAKVHIEDRGLQFADSVYEVIAVLNKKLIDYKYHFYRLRYSLKELNISLKVDQNRFLKIFKKLLEKNNVTNGIIYLQITRGIQVREHVYEKNIKPNIIIYSRKRKFNLPDKNFYGVNAITYNDLRWARRDIKTVNLLPNVIARNNANRKKAYEAILIKNNIITEGTSSNIWIIKNKKLYTHPSNINILKGVTRTSLKLIIKKMKLTFIEKPFSLKHLMNADEVFLTSSGSFITPIVKIDSKLINNGKIGEITLNLAKMYFKSCMNG